jgi:integrase
VAEKGIVVRHHRPCASRAGGECDCKTFLEAWVWSSRDKKKIYQTFTGKGALSEARNWRADAGSSVRKGKLRAAEPTTVAEAGAAWLAKARSGEVFTRKGRRYKPGSIREFDRSLRKYVYPEIGHMRLANVERRDIQRIVENMVGMGLSGSTIENAVIPVRILCRLAIRDGQFEINPTTLLDLPAAAGVRDRVATPAEAATLLGLVPVGDRAVWATAFYAGLRRGELRALRVEDIDFTNGEIRVCRSWDDKEGVIEPKSENGKRVAPLAGALKLILLEHQARTGRRGGDLVFGRTTSLPFGTNSLRDRALKAWASEYTCGCKPVKDVEACPEHKVRRHRPITLHECRHTYVSIMHAAGNTLEEIGDFVGHGSTYMTDRYRHLLDGQRQRAAQRFDAFLAASTGERRGEHARGVTTQAAWLSRIPAAGN